MAKRARGSVTRPGQRRPLQRSANRPATAPTTPPASTVTPAAPTALPGTLTDEEEARAAELEAEIVAQERQAETAQKTARIRSKEAASAVAVARTSTLAISAAEEYAYVARDVKRIVLVGGSLVIFLLVLWVIAHVTGFGPF